LNSADWFDNSNALYIRHGAPVSTTAFDCKSSTLNWQQFCDIQNPASGTWNILAAHTSGPGGAFQVTASLIGQVTVVPTPCVPGPTTLCLNGGRFRVQVSFATPLGTGYAAPGPVISDESGLLWFFSPGNWELALKVLDGCQVNRHYWVFFAALTDVEYVQLRAVVSLHWEQRRDNQRRKRADGNNGRARGKATDAGHDERSGGDSGDYRDEDERLQGYDVTYEYANRTYRTRTNYHPGDRIRVRVDVQPE
jgi:hypothetical protein